MTRVQKELRAPAGSIVYLPNDITYKSEWPAGETGEYISINFQMSESFSSSARQNFNCRNRQKNGYYLKMFKNAYDILAPRFDWI
ncbi:MAG: hypothetical protein L6V93_11425 [Clostridiales bacterium]|nr:MAG: hypothetical protein L6V93_11425 [Clostridiales bacterium]